MHFEVSTPSSRHDPLETFLQSKELETRRDRLKSAPYLRLKNVQRTTIGNIWKIFFQKKFFGIFCRKNFFFTFLESRIMPKNSKRGHSGSLNVFTNRKLQKKCKGLPFDRIRKVSKKSRIVPKKNGKNQTKKNLLWSRIYFWKHKKFVV